VDSIQLNAAFYNTASTPRLAVMYSKSGFTTDSSNFTGGTLLSDGTSLVTATSGTFTNVVTITNQTGTSPVNYRLALNNATGVTIVAGNTLTVRLYFACSSGSAGRYAKVRDVYIKGLVSPALPLSITAFSAKKGDNSSNNISWTTETEINVDKFQVERSADAQHFETIGTVKAVGNSKGQQVYNFVDAQPVSGVNYYRLTTLDVDGTWYLSKIVSVDSRLDKSFSTSVYPNPVGDVLHLLVNDNADAKGLTIELKDAVGRVVYTQQVVSVPTNQGIDVSMLPFPSGIYFLTVSNGSVSTVHKVVK
jgi:hypothetical protein